MKASIAWLQRYLISTILVAVAIHQMFWVHGAGLSSWRGGGFGMYAGYHPRHFELWVDHKDTGELVHYTKETFVEGQEYADLRPFLTLANQTMLDEYFDSLTPEQQAKTAIELWRLDFDKETLLLRRKQILAAGDRRDEPR